jgi:Ran GTPase-activating protein (RanGAP) involved in mRNA processing and transport
MADAASRAALGGHALETNAELMNEGSTDEEEVVASEEARECVRLRCSPESRALAGVARNLIAQGRWADAVEAAVQAVDLSPEYAVGRCVYGFACYKDRQSLLATQQLRRACQLEQEQKKAKRRRQMEDEGLSESGWTDDGASTVDDGDGDGASTARSSCASTVSTASADSDSDSDSMGSAAMAKKEKAAARAEAARLRGVTAQSALQVYKTVYGLAQKQLRADPFAFMETKPEGPVKIALCTCLDGSSPCISIQNEHVGTEEAIDVMLAVSNAPLVTDLNLESNEIGDEGAQLMSELLMEDTHLRTLNLAHNRLSADGIKAVCAGALANAKLEVLHEEPEDEEKEEVAWGGAAKAKAAADQAEAMKAEAQAALWGGAANVPAETPRELAPAKVAKPLKFLHGGLVSLSLHWNNAGAAGATHLGNLIRGGQLTALDIGVNQLGAAGGMKIAAALRSNTSLTSVGLGDNGLGDAGVMSIVDALRVNEESRVAKLDLHWNDCGDAAAGPVAAYIAAEPPLTHLNLHGSAFGSEGGRQIAT